ncbi:hypothetical protein [Streptomyces cucumeris]|uniref:hypothetical protein n=1 Tax=Streptomyces cucumeris TaxID=2962890 RepID=UPI0020C89BDF|nr:hypothetical protein [Streptomyces sp. NEAU-Y11]MCP9213314.1 hypothetical protein [Streptomyces sp. NEAU-Y11]
MPLRNRRTPPAVRLVKRTVEAYRQLEQGQMPAGPGAGALDALHLRKIDLADRILVVNPGGYIGESTSREIAYAHATGKPISFTDPSDQ